MESEKRVSILESATAVFAEKGFAEATISEIAKGAGMVGPALYKYFGGKEEILFTIIETFLEEHAEVLRDHLEGIQGAENKLRKAVWYHCRAYSSNRSRIKIVLESRSYPRFYEGAAYDALRLYASIFTGIIREGIDEGSFCGLNSPEIMRDMILGAVDHIAINWTIRDGTNSLDQAEALFELVMGAVRPRISVRPQPSKKDIKRAAMIDSATALFADKGFNDTSMLEIARQAGVAEGTVYEYFGNKEQLLISIPSEKLGALYDHLSGNALESKLSGIISTIFQFYNDEKSYTTILVLMLRTNKRFHDSESNAIIDKLYDLIGDLIVKGQAEGRFKPDLNIDLCRHLLFGTLDHIIIPWVMFNRNYDFPAIGQMVADLFVHAVKA